MPPVILFTVEKFKSFKFGNILKPRIPTLAPTSISMRIRIMDMELGYYLDRALSRNYCKRESLTRLNLIVPGLLSIASKSV